MRRHEWKTPIEQFNGDQPDVSYFRVFGTRAYVWIPSNQRQDKLSPKSEEMIFIGYESNTKGYRFGLKKGDEYSFPRMLSSMKKFFLIVLETKKMDLPLFLLKMKICSQH
jgi:hypothetical protein